MTCMVYIRLLEDRHMEVSWPGLCIRKIETLRHKKYVFPIQGVLNKSFKLTPLSTNSHSQFQPYTNTNLVLLYRIYKDDSKTINYSESIYTSATKHPSAFLFDTWSYSVWFPVSLPRLRIKFYALNTLTKIAFCMVEPKSHVLRQWASWACNRSLAGASHVGLRDCKSYIYNPSNVMSWNASSPHCNQSISWSIGSMWEVSLHSGYASW